MIVRTTRFANSLLFSASLLMTGALATPAQAQPVDPVAQAQTLHTAGDADAAYKLLAPLARDRAGDPQFDLLLGMSAVDTGRAGEAIIALQRVLARQPGNAQARSELARAYAISGDVDTARKQFATVVDAPSLPDPVRQRFTGIIKQYDREISGGGSDVSGFVDVQSGYDSNINSATDLTSIVIPLFAGLGPGTLAGAARATGDEFGEVQAGVSAVSAVSRQNRVFGSVLGNWRQNFDSKAFDQQSLTTTGGFAHSFASRDTLSLSGQVQQFWLGHASYRQGYGAVAQFTKLLPKGRALSLSAQFFRFDYERDRFRDSSRLALALSYADKNFAVTLQGGHEETRRQAGDSNSNSFIGANAGVELPISKSISFVGSAAFDLRKHDAPDALFLKKRQEERVDVSAGVKVLLTKNLYLRPRVSYTRNWSNIALYDHDRWTASVGLRAEF
jgi:tetratricopeptide (TPR) repeat protein